MTWSYATETATASIFDGSWSKKASLLGVAVGKQGRGEESFSKVSTCTIGRMCSSRQVAHRSANRRDKRRAHKQPLLCKRVVRHRIWGLARSMLC